MAGYMCFVVVANKGDGFVRMKNFELFKGSRPSESGIHLHFLP